MKIVLNREGGFAGGIPQSPQIVDTTQLPRDAKNKLEGLAEAAKVAPDVKRPRHARDSMTFTISIDDGRGKPTVLKQPDVAMSAPFAELLESLERLSKQE